MGDLYNEFKNGRLMGATALNARTIEVRFVCNSDEIVREISALGISDSAYGSRLPMVISTHRMMMTLALQSSPNLLLCPQKSAHAPKALQIWAHTLIKEIKAVDKAGVAKHLRPRVPRSRFQYQRLPLSFKVLSARPARRRCGLVTLQWDRFDSYAL